MHGVRRKLLEAQAKAISIPLHIVNVPDKASMEEYSEIVQIHVQGLVHEGYRHTGFGDIFLEDLRTSRELARVKLQVIK
jgi:diphthamide synthase (EF-2-diphthine--ammonia ligase)